MANSYGYDYLSEDDIRAAQEQQWNQAVLQAPGDANVVAAVAQQRSLSNLLPSKEIRTARATQDMFKALESEVTREEGEDELDFQIRYAKELRQRAAKVDPRISIQANEKIYAAAKEKKVQAALNAEAARKQETHDQDIREAEFNLNKDKHAIAVYAAKRDDRGNLIGVKKMADSYEAFSQDPAAQAAFQELGEGWSMTTGDELNQLAPGDGGYKMLTPRQMQTSAKELSEYGITFAGFANTLQGLAADPLSLTAASDELAKGESWAGFMERMGIVPPKGFYEGSLVQSDSDVDGFIDRAYSLRWKGSISAANKGRIKALAYQLAKTLDPGGRLSDQDVSMAMEMLVGNGDPNVIRSLLEERVGLMQMQANDLLYAAETGQLGQFAAPAQYTYKKGLEAYQKALEVFVNSATKSGAVVREENRRTLVPVGAEEAGTSTEGTTTDELDKLSADELLNMLP